MASGDCGILLDGVAISEWYCWKINKDSGLSLGSSSMGRIKFNMAGVVMNEIAGCEGVLKDDNRVVSTSFSGRCTAEGLEMAVLMAIKEAAEMVIELIRKEQVPLNIECDSSTISDWLKYSCLRPWSFRNLFADIEGSLRRMVEVQIEVTNRGKNGMAKALAKAGLSRNTLFRAYW
ncbi:hypothetical protein CXB51_015968 [Gossypium anomalum]|uniref:RNase H type-1 domain-containing protein n=1 Tax=Gossypium anomalum TaxID=47600 RepID=A0A8J5YHX6_9ROSI|nr:hypothetical protein CXB51_015968 [Gossypium anomalum]